LPQKGQHNNPVKLDSSFRFASLMAAPP